jgi:methyl-accepting chemotaxis protein
VGQRDLLREAIASELDACTKHVRALIDQATSLTEREVLAAGERVADMHREAEGNVESLQIVGRQFGTSEAAGRVTLDATMRRNAAVMRGYTQRLSEGIERQAECTAAVTGVARKITAFVSGVERVSVELRMLTLNARLEAARWGSRGAAFATVASSMRDLTGEVAKSNEQIGGLATELSGIATRVAESEKLMEELSKGLTGDVQSQMDALSGAYEATRTASAEAVASGVARGRRLVELSNAVLSNLQFQDRMSQVLREAELVVARAESVTAELLAVVPEEGSEADARAAIEAVLARAGRPVTRLSGESELAASDASLDAGAVELF